jgi:transposase InsO family protein
MLPGSLICWYQHGASMRLIEPGKPNQNAHIESFSGRLRDESLSEHWFLNLAYAQAVIDAWRGKYNEEQVKKALGDGRTDTVPCMSAYSTFDSCRQLREMSDVGPTSDL